MLSNGLRALLISDQQSDVHKRLDSNLSQNHKHSTSVEAAGLCSSQEPSQSTDVDTQEPLRNTIIDTLGELESDDSDSSWTDVSSDSDKSDDLSESAASDSADSCGCSDRKAVSGKKQSQHSQHGHSSSSLLTCGGEKLVRTAFYHCTAFYI